jgi:hypothetical protein
VPVTVALSEVLVPPGIVASGPALTFGSVLTVTTISALGPSQLLTFVWLTQYEVLPDTAVEGVGAVVLPVPPVAVVYHNSPVPVAVSAAAVVPWQYVTGVVTAGTGGKAFTVTTISALGLSQPIV